jgi:GNAT superfamily N-acetyltransferase
MGPEGSLVQPRFARGCRCFAVVLEGVIAGYGWLSTGREWIGELQLEITPGPREAYVWNCATISEHRRKGIFRSLLVGISAAARAEGFRRLWIGSVAIPAERAVAPTGFRPAARFRTYNLLGLYLMTTSFLDSDLERDARRVVGDLPGLLGGAATRRRH